MYTTFFTIVFIVIGLLLMLAPPILLGVAIRAIFRKVNRGLLSFFGGAIMLLVMTTRFGDNHVFDHLVPALLTVKQTSPAFAALMVIVVIISSMAFPFLMVRIGIIGFDRFGMKQKDTEPASVDDAETSALEK